MYEIILCWWSPKKKRTFVGGHRRGRRGRIREDDEGEYEEREQELDDFCAKFIGTVK